MTYKELRSNLRNHFRGNCNTNVIIRKTIYIFRKNRHFRVVSAPRLLVGWCIAEGYVIEMNKDKSWKTYYSERGKALSERHFSLESEACSFFEKWCKGEIKYWEKE